MNLLKNLTVRWVPLISEQLWIYLTVEILWNLLCGREPFRWWAICFAAL